MGSRTGPTLFRVETDHNAWSGTAARARFSRCAPRIRLRHPGRRPVLRAPRAPRAASAARATGEAVTAVASAPTLPVVHPRHPGAAGTAPAAGTADLALPARPSGRAILSGLARGLRECGYGARGDEHEDSQGPAHGSVPH